MIKLKILLIPISLKAIYVLVVWSPYYDRVMKVTINPKIQIKDPNNYRILTFFP